MRPEDEWVGVNVTTSFVLGGEGGDDRVDMRGFSPTPPRFWRQSWTQSCPAPTCPPPAPAPPSLSRSRSECKRHPSQVPPAEEGKQIGSLGELGASRGAEYMGAPRKQARAEQRTWERTVACNPFKLSLSGLGSFIGEGGVPGCLRKYSALHSLRSKLTCRCVSLCSSCVGEHDKLSQ